MKKITNVLLITILFCLMFVLASCDTVAVYQRPGYGPPSHAPAHGLRNKQPKTVVIVRSEN